MQTNVLIIGGGICGTLLSWFLHKEGKSFVVIDNGAVATATKVAAGIINPVTGRRYVESWMIDVVMPFAQQTYEALGAALGSPFIHAKSIIDFFPSAQMRDAFVTRITEDDTFLHSYPDQNHFNQYFNQEFGCGEVRPAYIVHLAAVIAAWEKKLASLHALRPETFDVQALKVETDGITYGDITANYIIFCDGIAGAENPFFKALPFSPNKGEALVIEAAGLTNEHVFKKGLMLAPMEQKNYYWVGSNYQWAFEDAAPSALFYEKTKALLQQWLKVPFTIHDHKAAVRPATLERRPFVGLHPVHERVGILNGMGTKGTSLAPFFAHQLVQHLVHGLPLTAEADVRRFSRILSKESDGK